ncbi:hypothetical protein BSKO_03260 [Bryopsis sp. KO-2023]|nr:hypothetical protein BSKO_03260 [Bryopsis sp. KO-2023]
MKGSEEDARTVRSRKGKAPRDRDHIELKPSSRKSKDKRRSRDERKSQSRSVSAGSVGRSKSPRSRSRSPDVGAGRISRKDRHSEKERLKSKRKADKRDAAGTSSSEEGEVRKNLARNEGNQVESGRGVNVGNSSPDETQRQEGEGDLSMSVDETNKLRLKLGLKPLEVGKPKREQALEKKAREERAEAEKARETIALKEKIEEAKKRRRINKSLEGVKGLGEASSGDEDVEDWVEKFSQVKDKTKKEEVPAEKPSQSKEDDSDEDAPHPDAKDLAGMKVRHGVDEIGDGETMILTLADVPILDEKGRLNEADDELENALRVEQKKRKKAYEDSKPKEEFDVDGKKVSLWDKYDEEEQEAAFVLNEAGTASVPDRHKKEEAIRGKLMEGLEGDPGVTQTDYYTQEEVAVMRKPKKKRKKKQLRQKEVVADVIAGLEKEAQERGGESWSKDHGSRKDRIARVGKSAQEEAEKRAAKVGRFEKALTKANVEAASLRAQPDVRREVEGDRMDVDEAAANRDAVGKGAMDVDEKKIDIKKEEPEIEDNEEDELYEALNRARQVVQKGRSSAQHFENLASEAEVRRQHELQKVKDEKVDPNLVFTDTSEFCRTIELADEDKGLEPPLPEAEKEIIQEEKVTGTPKEEPAAAGSAGHGTTKPDVKKRAAVSRWTSSWVPADSNQNPTDPMETDDAPSQGPSRRYRSKKEESPKQESLEILREAALGTGIAAALGTLRDKGDLRQNFEWVGRTNDMKKGKLLGVDDVYQGDPKDDDDRLEQSIRAALTRKDELGRILTPKEAFRGLSYAFHGKCPSKSTIEKRERKNKEEYLARRANLNQTTQLEQFKQVQKVQGSAFVVLSGKGKIGATVQGASGARDPGKKAAKGANLAPTPVLGKSSTPLTGSKKVEVMFGIKKKSGGGGDSNGGAVRK